MSSEIAFIGIDTETTGLDPVNDHLLEIAVVAFDRNLRPLASFGTVFVTPETTEIIATRGEGLHEIPREMHEKTGLWDDLQKASAQMGQVPPVPLRMFDLWLCSELDHWFEAYGTPDHKLPILGSSVHFDRRFMETRLPKLLSRFSHRHIDPSSDLQAIAGADPVRAKIIEAEFEHSPECAQFEDLVSGEKHRAQYDIHRSAAIIRYLYRTVNFASLFPLHVYPKEN